MGLGSMTRQIRLPDLTDNASVLHCKLNIMKNVAGGLGDPSDGLHDLPLEIINWNAE